MDALTSAAETPANIGVISAVYKIAKEVTNSSTNIEHPVKDIDGRLLGWKSHFSSVLNLHFPENAPPYTGRQPRMRTNTRINTDAPA